MNDVLFITPNDRSALEYESVGTLQLATILKNNGVRCRVVPFWSIGSLERFAEFLDSAVTLVGEEQPKIVSFYTRCDTYHIVLRMAQRIKQQFPNIYIVCGGPQSDITAEDTIRQIPWVDFVCCGEGETTIYPFFTSLLQESPDLSIAGLVYRCADTVCKNPRPEYIADLDSLDAIDYSLTEFGKQTEDPFPIDVGRGCPFACTFCSTKTFWGRKYRLKSPKRIVEEIQSIHDKFGKTQFKFAHDMFTMNRSKVIETCELIQKLDFPVEWSCSARTDCIDKELLDVMADAGMKSIYFGIESGSARMQMLINKKLKLDSAVELMEHLDNRNVEYVASFIFGFPEETEEDLSQTMAMIGKILSLKKSRVQTHLCTFMGGTELSQIYQSQMTPVETYSNITGSFAIEECKDLIEAYPELFQHMREYKTELRSKLRYFPVFFQYWKRVQPVFQYISEKYPENRLIEMYYDFVEANLAILKQLEEEPELRRSWLLLGRDKFVARFSQDENYELMTDICRWITMVTGARTSQENMTDVFCFDPASLKKRIPLQAYPKCITYARWDNGKITTQVYPMDTLGG